MVWKADRAQARIKEFQKTVPTVDTNIALDGRRELLEARKSQLMDRLPTRRAFPVEGAHLYGHLLDFDEIVSENGRETEASHRKLLQFLHAHYRVWDALVDADGGDRVDYHGARLHAVVTDPARNPSAQIERAIALAHKLTDAAEQIGRAQGISSRVRFGIDHGKCLAITTGRSYEKDTLFLGAPANHAAKLAAAQNVPGIFLTETAQNYLHPHGQIALDAAYLEQAARGHRFQGLDSAIAAVTDRDFNLPDFRFRRATPPLSNLKFSDLSPSKSVRMSMASIFADVDGFTAFVDQAIRNGAVSINKAVEAIHVIREELNAVLRDDFGGKRIRFIGDCIHGCVAEGANADNATATVDAAALCASSMGDSFKLCLAAVRPDANIGLAVGVEYGPTPLTRAGDVGPDSTRCAVSRATVHAEKIQQSIQGSGFALGPVADGVASLSLRRTYAAGRLVSYDAAADLLASPASPAIQVVREHPAARPHLSKGRVV